MCIEIWNYAKKKLVFFDKGITKCRRRSHVVGTYIPARWKKNIKKISFPTFRVECMTRQKKINK